jgi:hypothetical protein
MFPQGTSILNPSYFTSLIHQFNGAGTCAELQAAVNRTFASLQAEATAVEEQIELLEAMLALLVNPGADLQKIATWVENYILNVLTPQLKPAITYSTQLTQFATQIATLTSAIEDAAALIKGCSITVPTIT